MLINVGKPYVSDNFRRLPIRGTPVRAFTAMERLNALQARRTAPARP